MKLAKAIPIRAYATGQLNELAHRRLECELKFMTE